MQEGASRSKSSAQLPISSSAIKVTGKSGKNLCTIKFEKNAFETDLKYIDEDKGDAVCKLEYKEMASVLYERRKLWSNCHEKDPTFAPVNAVDSSLDSHDSDSPDSNQGFKEAWKLVGSHNAAVQKADHRAWLFSTYLKNSYLQRCAVMKEEFISNLAKKGPEGMRDTS
jgi:hypothetical protein